MIREVIVVEGKHDTTAIRRAVQADTIETGGSALNREILTRIELAHQLRGVIVMTDPDHAGERIRKIVSAHIPGCKHAFISEEHAIRDGDVGVEYASPEAIRAALAEVRTEAEVPSTNLTWADMTRFGLTGMAEAAERRYKIGRFLRIGYANAKTFMKRCAMFGIQRQDLVQALAACGYKLP